MADVLINGVTPGREPAAARPIGTGARRRAGARARRRRPARTRRRTADGRPVPRTARSRSTAIRPNPRQPRTVFDEDALAELTHSIREFGLLQPIVVREPTRTARYELVMGERRWRAAQRAGLATIPAIVRQTADDAMLRDALLENIHRAKLNPLEEAAAYQQLLEEFDVTQEELADAHRPQPPGHLQHHPAAEAARARPAPGRGRRAVRRARPGAARARGPGRQEQLAARIVAEGLSVRGAEEAVDPARRPRRPAARRPPSAADARAGPATIWPSALSDAFDTRVRLELGRSKGRIVVEFATVEDLERIVTIMAPQVRIGRPTTTLGAGSATPPTLGRASRSTDAAVGTANRPPRSTGR